MKRSEFYRMVSEECGQPMYIVAQVLTATFRIARRILLAGHDWQLPGLGKMSCRKSLVRKRTPLWQLPVGVSRKRLKLKFRFKPMRRINEELQGVRNTDTRSV